MRIETERIIITEFDLSMAESVHRNSLDEDNRRFVPDEVFETVEEATETIEFLMSVYESGEGPLVYPVLLKNGANIGYVQLVPIEEGFEVGYHIGKEYTSRGYATEALKAFLNEIMPQKNLDRVYGICVSENIASKKVMEKCGFEKQYEGIGEYQGESREIAKYIWRRYKMKKIGLVGGTGPESTIMYYKELNSKIDEATGCKTMPELSIESVNFRKAWELVATKQHEELADYLSEKVKLLVESGAEIIALTAATMHMVFDEVESKTNVSLVSIPKAVCNKAKNKGYKKVGLLGTIFTMEQDFMKKDLQQAGIDVIVPDKADRELIAKRILEELEVGIVKESTLKEFNQIIKNMQEMYGIEAVVLGCTELPLILNDGNCVLPCLDSVAIHIEELIELAQN